MATTQTESDGNFSLKKTEAAIAYFEIYFKSFVDSTMVSAPEGNLNRMNFEELNLTRPNAFKLTLSTDQPPAGYSKIWNGMMFIEGVPASVTAWRAE